jgi:hypothetical protein
MPGSIKTLLRICLFSANPQDLPQSRHFLAGCVIAAMLVLLVGYNLLPTETNPVVLAASHILFIGVSWLVLLLLTRKGERWMQSASAMYGTSAILNLVSIPLIASNDHLISPDPAAGPNFTTFAFVSLWIWEIAVTACIIRETLEIKMRKAVFISLLMTFAMQFIMVTLFSPAR